MALRELPRAGWRLKCAWWRWMELGGGGWSWIKVGGGGRSWVEVGARFSNIDLCFFSSIEKFVKQVNQIR